jgi:hypothetical protein
MAETGLVKVDLTKIVPSAPLSSVTELTQRLSLAREQDAAFVLTPLAVIDHIKPFHRISLRALYIDPTVTKVTKDNYTFWKAGPHCYFNPVFMSQGEVGLSKNGLVAILAASGANPITTRLDDRSNPHVAEFAAVVYHQDFDGTWRQYPGTKRVDLSDGSPGAIAMKPKQLEIARQFIAENAESKAILRAIRPLFGLAQVYKADDLKRKPWLCPKLVKQWDLNDPDQKRAAIAESMGDEHKLFGGLSPTQAALAPVTAPPAEPPTTAPPATPPGPPAATAKPAAQPEPPQESEQEFEDDLPDFDKPTILVCSCPCGCQGEVTPAVAEKTKEKLKGVIRCQTCYPGKVFNYEKHKDLSDLQIPRWPKLTADEIRKEWEGRK